MLTFRLRRVFWGGNSFVNNLGGESREVRSEMKKISVPSESHKKQPSLFLSAARDDYEKRTERKWGCEKVQLESRYFSFLFRTRGDACNLCTTLYTPKEFFRWAHSQSPALVRQKSAAAAHKPLSSRLDLSRGLFVDFQNFAYLVTQRETHFMAWHVCHFASTNHFMDAMMPF